MKLDRVDNILTNLLLGLILCLLMFSMVYLTHRTYLYFTVDTGGRVFDNFKPRKVEQVEAIPMEEIEHLRDLYRNGSADERNAIRTKVLRYLYTIYPYDHLPPLVLSFYDDLRSGK